MFYNFKAWLCQTLRFTTSVFTWRSLVRKICQNQRPSYFIANWGVLYYLAHCVLSDNTDDADDSCKKEGEL